MISKLNCKFYKFYISGIVNEILVIMKKEVLVKFLDERLISGNVNDFMSPVPTKEGK